ncbi:neprilysin-2-like [Photinus pyralis]|uniref:neprilysin-2-like n=1 Tax=Photinus pyralis TaxID=7054 RepID=UPI001267399C|nr:neprilysin-2-like [Photinus pyralis]XP_031344651.1 neprilysin-2-like [Photinus pyralis]XP_031344652.1 neprilysin-2-like [Photinus pyralis]
MGLSTRLFDYENAAKSLVLPVNQINWVKWGELAIYVGVLNDLKTNEIVLPAAILQGIFFSNDRPHYMNYGAIGFAIAELITHGFDDKGRQFDKYGNLEDWWVPSTKEKFITKVQCMIDQYGNYFVSELGLNLNGVRTQGDNTASNGGMKNAYLAYNERVRLNGKELLLPGLNYTDRQLFWISAANSLCENQKPDSATGHFLNSQLPRKFSINGALSNTDYFAKDFNCRVGSKMNPVSKCEVWRSL